MYIGSTRNDRGIGIKVTERGRNVLDGANTN